MGIEWAVCWVTYTQLFSASPASCSLAKEVNNKRINFSNPKREERDTDSRHTAYSRIEFTFTFTTCLLVQTTGDATEAGKGTTKIGTGTLVIVGAEVEEGEVVRTAMNQEGVRVDLAVLEETETGIDEEHQVNLICIYH